MSINDVSVTKKPAKGVDVEPGESVKIVFNSGLDSELKSTLKFSFKETTEGPKKKEEEPKKVSCFYS